MDWNSFIAQLPKEQNREFNKLDVLIIGYTTCPYSGKAIKLMADRPKYKTRFIAFGVNNPACLQTVDAFRNTFQYRGSFPVVFLREDGEMHYIGGATDLEQTLKDYETGWGPKDVHW